MLAMKLKGGGAADKLYVDDVFSAYTYTGNGSTQTITNGIDLAGKGGMVWRKRRDNVGSHNIIDSARGISVGSGASQAGRVLKSDLTDAEAINTTGSGGPYDITSFNSNGFSIGPDWNGNGNTNTATYVSWTFRNADKFYGHSTVTKSAGSNATVSFANLVTLGMVRVKRTDSTGSWYVWHKNLTAGKLLVGETTAAEATLGHITVSGTTVTLVNGVIADGSYLVEAFAHDASTDGIIQCGSFTTDGSGNATVSLGWETQCVMVKRSDSTGPWMMLDQIRGMPTIGGTRKQLLANTSGAETDEVQRAYPTATGFGVDIGLASATYIYLAIRRPNKPPTSGTQVYNAIARTGTGAAATVTGVGFAPDLVMTRGRTIGYESAWQDRLRGATKWLVSASTNQEATNADSITAFGMDGVSLGADAAITYWNSNTITYINHFFRRAPGVFDQVCYLRPSSEVTLNHNLGAVPELIITKNRTTATVWLVYTGDIDKYLRLEVTNAIATSSGTWGTAYPTSTTFRMPPQNGNLNDNCVAYLFATLPGISKVGSYTGNGTNQTINCGFSAGARFILIKRTDSTGDWFVWDTVRGIVAGNDPHLSLNTTAAEVATDDSIDPDNSGFIVNQLAATNINVSSATYIFLALA